VRSKAKNSTELPEGSNSGTKNETGGSSSRLPQEDRRLSSFRYTGDLAVNLFLKFGRRKGLKIITFPHEPDVDFAADA